MPKSFFAFLLLVAGFALSGCAGNETAATTNRVPGAPMGAQPNAAAGGATNVAPQNAPR